MDDDGRVAQLCLGPTHSFWSLDLLGLGPAPRVVLLHELHHAFHRLSTVSLMLPLPERCPGDR